MSVRVCVCVRERERNWIELILAGRKMLCARLWISHEKKNKLFFSFSFVSASFYVFPLSGSLKLVKNLLHDLQNTIIFWRGETTTKKWINCSNCDSIIISISVSSFCWFFCGRESKKMIFSSLKKIDCRINNRSIQCIIQGFHLHYCIVCGKNLLIWTEQCSITPTFL